ncbi:MAG: hypothetical protein K0B02_03065 [DPANN group archaeon]|nr:hypothetical protein [DPANN group archaeon]
MVTFIKRSDDSKLGKATDQIVKLDGRRIEKMTVYVIPEDDAIESDDIIQKLLGKNSYTIIYDANENESIPHISYSQTFELT